MPESDLKVQEGIKEFFGIQPCLWQIHIAQAVLAGDDVVTIAPTGLGKSLTYWIPLRYITNGIIVAITPLKQLGLSSQPSSKITLQPCLSWHPMPPMSFSKYIMH